MKTFNKCKAVLTSDRLLVHYDAKKTLRLACDASPYGLGAVLSHVFPNGEERPVAYASKTLTSCQKNYSQGEKEALAIMFGLNRYQQYLIGRRFTLVTDHKPLVTIFGPSKGIPVMASERLKRWALLLSNFDYEIEFKKGSQHMNADCLSRLPIESGPEFPESQIFKLSCVDDLPVTSKDIASATRNDPELGIVMRYIQQGWPTEIDKKLKPYYDRQDELGIDLGCITWGVRILIPTKYRESMLELLHDTHPGMTKMKAVARSYLWWPGLDQDIENLSRSCMTCQKTQPDPPSAPFKPWIWPKGPWVRIHLDFPEKNGLYYLVITHI